MADAISHRGPDDRGSWCDPDAGILLGHRRLSIIDVTPLGHQPMVSSDGRWVVSYNGEIYNHLALRRDLEATTNHAGWRGHSDTETLIECVAAWGLEETLSRSVGMFALAIWDRKDRQLYLARDRFGEKPLYYGWVGHDFVFASELKAIQQHPNFDNRVSREAVALFAERTYIPAPFSIYEMIYKLEPGCILRTSSDSFPVPASGPPAIGSRHDSVSVSRYWSYQDVLVHGLSDPFDTEDEALENLNEVLSSAISGQSVADVPVGAFLSGGIDSSIVVALYQNYSSTPVHTFSIGFDDAKFNEAKHAKKVAQHLGTIHNELYVTVEEARKVIPLLPSIYDEPFADSSQIPTFLVSRFARKNVAVALSGDGGDELFAGYNRHFAAPALWRRANVVPRIVRAAAGWPLSKLPSSIWNLMARGGPANRGAKVQNALRVAATATSLEDVYNLFLNEWSFDGSPVLGASDPSSSRLKLDTIPQAPDALQIMYRDATAYLPDDILCKVDRAAMSVSLETRIPFLDHRVAEVASRIPMSMKVRGGRGKYIVRELLASYLPPSMFERAKAGFAIPVGEWLKGPLRGWAEDLLDPVQMAEAGWFDPRKVRHRWQLHLSGRRESTSALWAILMFQAWSHEYLKR